MPRINHPYHTHINLPFSTANHSALILPSLSISYTYHHISFIYNGKKLAPFSLILTIFHLWLLSSFSFSWRNSNLAFLSDIFSVASQTKCLVGLVQRVLTLAYQEKNKFTKNMKNIHFTKPSPHQENQVSHLSGISTAWPWSLSCLQVAWFVRKTLLLWPSP